MAGSMGPDSFALNGSGGVVLQQPNVSPVATQTQVAQGGTGAPSLAPGGEFAQQADDNGRTMDALNKLTQGALEPYVQAEQRKLYFDGAARVAQGQALQDIEKDQPWYTKIFGPSSSVQGAQAYTAMTAISNATTAFQEAMPDLRRQDPDTVRQFLVNQAASVSNTGDPVVDGLIQSKMMENLPTMLNTHMQQHVMWQQEDMGNKFVNNAVASANTYQSVLRQKDGLVDAGNIEQARNDFLTSLQRPPGMTDEAYGKYVASAAVSNLSTGNFDAYGALKATPALWNALPMQSRVYLENSEEQWTQKKMRKDPALADIHQNMTTFVLSLSHGSFPGTLDDVNKWVDDYNTKFKAQTGSSVDPIDNVARDKIVKEYATGRQRLEASVLKAQASLADDQAQRDNVAKAINGGSSAILAPGVTEENARAATEEYWHSVDATDPVEFANGVRKLALVSDEKKLRPSALEGQLRQDLPNLFVTGGQITPRQQASLHVAATLLAGPNGPQALSNYVGEDTAKKTEMFVNAGVDPADPKGLETTRTWIRQGTGAVPTKADRDEASSYVSSQDPGWFKRIIPFFGGPGQLTSFNLNDETRQRLAGDLAPAIATTRKAFPGMPEDSAAQYAYQQVYGNQQSTDFVDGTIVKRNIYMSGAQSLYSAVNALNGGGVSQATSQYQEAVKQTARANLRDAVTHGVNGINAGARPGGAWADIDHFDDSRYVAVGGEQVGRGITMVYYQDKKDGGRVYPVLLRPEQVYKNYANTPDRTPGADPTSDPLTAKAGDFAVGIVP